MGLFWEVFGRFYGLYYLVVGTVVLLGRAGVIKSKPIIHPTQTANDFMLALYKTGYFFPMIAVAYIAGGVAMQVPQTLPLGLAILAGPVAGITAFHFFLSKRYAWGMAFGLSFAAIALRHMDAFVPLWSHTAGY
ncbi:MAG: hypothetical protein RLZZ58_1890 [Pseudomonadota bacterium]|jgi:uncharacterized membrane protein